MKEVVAGVDIGGTNTVFGLVDRGGVIVAEKKLCTTSYPEIDDFVSVLTSSILRLVAGNKDLKLKGIGIGAPNANYHKGTVKILPSGVSENNAAVLDAGALIWNELEK